MVEVDQAKKTKQDEDEEAMLNLVKTFKSNELKAFIEKNLLLPPSIHDNFGRLRQSLATRSNQFKNLGDMKLQLDYFYELFQEMEVFPKQWLSYASCCFFFEEQKHFVEGSEMVFQSEVNLGRVLSMRARYTILGLKDLLSLRALTSQDAASMQGLAKKLQLFSGEVEMVRDEESANSCFISALAAFDADA